ncbi:hypothetical protein REPUB_Repub14bG0142900 [Reevesia pubescens]
MILANDEKNGNEVIADPHLLPATHINFTDDATLFTYISSTKNPTAYITQVKTELNTKPASFMAYFSSRGPSLIEPSILNPDITAPEVSIIAAFTKSVSPTEDIADKHRIPFISQSGTSMSCPHMAGIIGLLKSLHPDWRPVAIKSAIITSDTSSFFPSFSTSFFYLSIYLYIIYTNFATPISFAARTRDNTEKPILDSNNKKATPFAYGAGHVKPNRAMDSGLVYDLTIDDYMNYLCGLAYNESMIRIFSDKPYTCPKSFSVADLNYPSISVPQLSGSSSTSVRRKVKNVGSPGTYKARVKSPARVRVSVNPSTLKFKKIGEEKEFEVTFMSKSNCQAGGGGYVFGHLIWSDGHHYVKSPIVVKHKYIFIQLKWVIKSSSDDSIRSQQEVMSRVRGKEHCGRVRGLELGPTPTQVFGSSRFSANMFTQSFQEFDKMKTKIVELEAQVATIPQLEARMDSLMAIIKENFSNINIPLQSQVHSNTNENIASLSMPSRTSTHN